jgi:NADPH-dependent glutamate synthase beta subunit-like oxidoreductase/ferredoxin
MRVTNPTAKYHTGTVVGRAPSAGPQRCTVADVRWALYDTWKAAASGPDEPFRLLAHVLRLVTTVAIGRGEAQHLSEIRDLGGALGDVPAVAAVLSSLDAHEGIWLHHVEQGCCPTEVCDISSIAPCRQGCPAGINIPSFLADIGHGKNAEAIGIIVQDNPLPFVCALVCPAPCEDACVRGSAGQEPVFIREMKAVAAEQTLGAGAYPHREQAPPSGKRVAILGSGPAALSASWYLALMGHGVTCFEREPAPGGMLRFGIPGFRLPPEVLRQEVEQIRHLGVEFRTDTQVEHIDELKQGHDAVFIAVGTQTSRVLPLPGVDNDFVLGAIEFLRAVREDRAPEIGNRVVVVGGGSVAMDVLLTAKRLGSEQVELFCLERREEMPAHPRELEEVEAAGIRINNAWGPLRIEKTTGTGESPGRIVFQHCDSLFDDQHHFDPAFDRENTAEREIDQIILAIGQATDLRFVAPEDQLRIDRHLLAVHPESLETDAEGVFAGGDAVHGPRLVVDAVADGKRAAHAIDAYLSGGTIDPQFVRFRDRSSSERAAVSADVRTDTPRVEPNEREVSLRYGEATLVELALPTRAQAETETHRCLRCDLCVGCGLCEMACAEMGVRALRMEHVQPGRLAYLDFRHPQDHCIGCGSCAQVCPHDAIRLVDRDGRRKVEITGTTVSDLPLVKCRSCGAEYATEAFVEHLQALLPASLKPGPERRLCPDCARGAFAEALDSGAAVSTNGGDA